jgi:membrane associated rhomboid family serine protease
MINRMLPALAVLALAIIAAFLLELVAPPALMESTALTFAIVPSRWEQAFALGDYGVIALSVFGHVFLHGGWLHLIFNLVLLVSVGRALGLRLEQAARPNLRFLIVFFGSAAGAAFAYVAMNPGSTLPAIGASGAACGVYSAYLMAVHPDWRRSLRDPAVLQNGAVFLFANVVLAYLAATTGFLPIAWQAHLGGFIGGMAIYPLVAARPRALA